MSEISIMSMKNIDRAGRWDAEYYQPDYLKIENTIRKIGSIDFGNEIDLFVSGNNIPQTDAGYNFIRTQNIGDILLSLNDVAQCFF